MGKRFYLQFGALLALTILINLALFYWNAQVVDKSNALNANWQQETYITIEKASLLAKLERSMGYGGFIHNFKNFVLRGDELYFRRAQHELTHIYRYIDTFKQFDLSTQEQQAINAIRNTVELYAHKLLDARVVDKDREDIGQLDKEVKVDDSAAEQALDVLRKSLHVSYQQTLAQQTQLHDETTLYIKLGAYFLSPIVCLTAILNMLMLWLMTQLLRERNALIEITPDAIVYYNKFGKIWQVNEVAEKQFGYSRKEFLTMTMSDLLPNHFTGASYIRSVKKHLSHAYHREQENISTVVGIHKNGTKKRFRITATNVATGEGEFYIAVFHDLSEEQALLEKAHLDYLTGVYNRRQVYNLLERELARLNRYHRPLSVLLVDLDNFKPLNDNEGHLAGDLALKQLCQFLKESARPTDIIGRWGGDEFILVCPETGHHSVMSFARRLVEHYAQQAEHGLTLSIGVVAYDFVSDKLSADECVDQADQALYKAKSNGRNQAVMYQPDFLNVHSHT